MTSAGNQDWEEEFSVIGEKGEIGFIDYEDDKSVCSYNPIEEGPVIISVPFPFVRGKPQSILIGERSKCSITLENSTGESIELWATKIFCSNPADSFTLSLIEPPSENSTEEHIRSFLEGFSLEDRVLQPHSTLTLWLSCKPMDMGLHTSVVHFDVNDDRLERVVFLLAEDKVSQSLASSKPYLKGSRKKPFCVDEYVAGSRPSRGKNAKEYKNRLPRFDIPKEIQQLLESKQVPEVINEGLTRKNYAAFFTTLLIMEELHLKDEMSQFDMECVTMRRKGAQFVALEVPGLAEKRPSLMHGDVVFAKLNSHRSYDNTPPYEGYIHRVEADEVLLRFSPEFHTYHHNGNLYNIRFTFNRVGVRRTYQAIQEASKLDANLLFPAQSTTMRFIKTTPTVPITCNINEEQMHSVEMILGCEGIPPYVVYGPPGTGKTMTLVEAILQLYSTRKNTCILVCAASNSAADHILNKIIGNGAVEVKETEIFRLNAPSRAYDDVHPDHIRFCYFEDFVFQCPPLKALMRYRIVISTYMSTSLIHAEGVRRGHFSHIFLDEAGQASEPDTMVSLSHLCRKETVVVLAGDPMQLGPVVFSRDAERFGLGKSYLQRLFDCEFYSQEDENYVTKLVRNYRCHPAILHLPSELFYDGELLACKEEDLSNNDLSFDFLPSKDFPVLFFGIQGCDEREGNNPSWFNRFEASQVVKIIQKLTKNTDSDKLDIGVITPYRQQVAKLSKAIEDKGIEGIKVGSVEQFQGQEREVIIVSTVRSTIKHNDFDKTYSLGFLSNWRRFNVAITRAKSLLVIVGNPHIVSKDPYWDKLLRYCVDNNSYEGCSLPERNDYEEEEEEELRSNNEKMDDTQPSNEWLWGQSCQSEQVQELPAPATDESEWGDGWTS